MSFHSSRTVTLHAHIPNRNRVETTGPRTSTPSLCSSSDEGRVKQQKGVDFIGSCPILPTTCERRWRSPKWTNHRTIIISSHYHRVRRCTGERKETVAGHGQRNWFLYHCATGSMFDEGRIRLTGDNETSMMDNDRSKQAVATREFYFWLIFRIWSAGLYLKNSSDM